MAGTKELTSRAVLGMYYETLNEARGKAWVDNIAMRVRSDQESETYPWLGMVPALREYVGGREPNKFSGNSLQITNKDFEATVSIPKKDFRRDKTGQIMARIGELADRAISLDAKLIAALLVGGESAVCYDGDYYFGSAHAEGSSGAQTNIKTVDISTLGTGVHGSTTAPSVGEVALCVLEAIGQILTFKDNQGEPFNEFAQSFLVLGPPSMTGPILGAVTQQYLASGEQNPIIAGNFSVQAAISARLSTWTTKFAVIRNDGRVKPFIIQTEVDAEPWAIAEGSEYARLNKEYLFGVDYTGNVGYGLWQHSSLVSMT